jgi:DNA-binding NarL/FixJ family response regulator
MSERKNQVEEMKALSILIVGNHNPLRASLRDWVAMNLPRARMLEAQSGKDAIVVTLGERPDVVIFDTGVDVKNGIAATRRIREALPDVKIVTLTMHENPEYQAEAKAAGASVCLLKRNMGNELMPVLRDLLSQGVDG